MEVKIEKLVKGIKCVYIVLFDTGYYYIGSTKCFYSRAKNHKASIKYDYKKFSINTVHSPKSCYIMLLQKSFDYDYVVKLERDFLIYSNSDIFLLNKSKSIFRLNKLKEKVCKKKSY